MRHRRCRAEYARFGIGAMKTSGPTRNGVLFIATGEDYLSAAIRSARGVRLANPTLAIAVATDLIASVKPGVFDEVISVDRPHRRSKVDMLAKSPFDRTVFLDTDVEVVADLSGLFELLDRFDLALAHAHSRNKRSTTTTWQTELPDAFPQCNSGVLAYRKSPETTAFFDQWSRDFSAANVAKDQVTLRELLWKSDLRFFILPPEYNIRHTRYVRFWKYYEADPKILHLARLHQTQLPSGQWVAARFREVIQDLVSGFRVVGGAVFKFFTIGTRRY